VKSGLVVNVGCGTRFNALLVEVVCLPILLGILILHQAGGTYQALAVPSNHILSSQFHRVCTNLHLSSVHKFAAKNQVPKIAGYLSYIQLQGAVSIHIAGV
jgi:hypothetical protein